MNKPLELHGVGEMIHDGQYYDQINTFDDDLPFYINWCNRLNQETKVLELCCGTGRLTIPLAKVGVNITGLDIEPKMLEHAKTKAKQANLDIHFVLADMRLYELNEFFDLIIIPFNSLQNTYSQEDLRAVFTQVHKHLAPNGFFIMDVFNPKISKLANAENGKWQPLGKYHQPDGSLLTIKESGQYHTDTQVFRVVWRHEINGVVKDEPLDMRCFFPQELDALLYYNNFQIVHKYGDFDQSEFSSTSPKQIVVCQRL